MGVRGGNPKTGVQNMEINEKGVSEHLVVEIAKQGYRTKKSTKKGFQNTRVWGGGPL